MGRKKIYSKRFLIGLDFDQSMKLVNFSRILGFSYSNVVGLSLDYYFQQNKNLKYLI